MCPVNIAEQRGYERAVGRCDQNKSLFPMHRSISSRRSTSSSTWTPMKIFCAKRFVCCRPNGYVLITTPAFQWLWSHNDDLNAHKRRYTAKDSMKKWCARDTACRVALL